MNLPEEIKLDQEIAEVLTALTYYIIQHEASDVEDILNPVYLLPAKGETMNDVDHRNEALCQRAVKLLHTLGYEIHIDYKPSKIPRSYTYPYPAHERMSS